MRRFVEGVDRSQTTLFPETLDDWVDEVVLLAPLFNCRILDLI